jgi:hypothetical protein
MRPTGAGGANSSIGATFAVDDAKNGRVTAGGEAYTQAEVTSQAQFHYQSITRVLPECYEERKVQRFKAFEWERLTWS